MEWIIHPHKVVLILTPVVNPRDKIVPDKVSPLLRIKRSAELGVAMIRIRKKINKKRINYLRCLDFARWAMTKKLRVHKSSAGVPVFLHSDSIWLKFSRTALRPGSVHRCNCC